jgi:hypothetical protein
MHISRVQGPKTKPRCLINVVTYYTEVSKISSSMRAVTLPCDSEVRIMYYKLVSICRSTRLEFSESEWKNESCREDF